MEQKQLQQLRIVLKEELETLQEHIHEEPNAEDSELSSVDNHLADAATDLTTVTTEIALSELKEDETVKKVHMENVANVARKYLLNG